MLNFSQIAEFLKNVFRRTFGRNIPNSVSKRNMLILVKYPDNKVDIRYYLCLNCQLAIKGTYYVKKNSYL